MLVLLVEVVERGVRQNQASADLYVLCRGELVVTTRVGVPATLVSLGHVRELARRGCMSVVGGVDEGCRSGRVEMRTTKMVQAGRLGAISCRSECNSESVLR